MQFPVNDIKRVISRQQHFLWQEITTHRTEFGILYLYLVDVDHSKPLLITISQVYMQRILLGAVISVIPALSSPTYTDVQN